MSSENTASAPEKIKISSKGKRVFGFLFDLIIGVLMINSANQLIKPDNWDLNTTPQATNLVVFYGGLLTWIILRDIFPFNSPGKLILGMSLRNLKDIENQPAWFTKILRNLFLILLPVEVIFLLLDPYARRWGDKTVQSVVIDHPRALRVPMRLLLANLILFGFFFGAILFQDKIIKKSSAYQTALQQLKHHQPLLEQIGDFDESKKPEMDFDFSAQPPTAKIQIQVKGKLGSRIVNMNLLRQPSDQTEEWHILQIEFSPQEESP
ncbi:MAG: RDD family protein [SAR324 cluster bacterium]|nr:RDD family protein [SAR324 cluster bacterium]